MKAKFALLALFFSQMLAAETVLFSDNFDDELGFLPHWKINQSTVNGLVSIVSGTGFGNSTCAFLGKSSSAGGDAINSIEIKIDLSNHPQSALSFKIKSNNDENDPSDGLYFSDDGGATFTPVAVLKFLPANWCETWGEFPPIDIDRLATEKGLNPLSPNFVIRFQQQGDENADNDGLFFDEIKVFVPNTKYATLPFFDDFNSFLTLGEAWTVEFSEKTNVLASIPTKPTNLVSIIDGVGIDNSRCLFVGKICSDGAITNAVDLHLNLAGLPGAYLYFTVKDNDDETQNDDGLFFSNDGGKTFWPIAKFKPADWCDGWGAMPFYDLKKLAADKGLTFTSECIVRFQQHDDENANNDGLFLDNVNVFVPKFKYATLPFFDDFENSLTLGDVWKWHFADQTTTLAVPANKPSGFAKVFAGAGFGGSRGLVFAKSCYETLPSANALDLYADLENASSAFLDFLYKDNLDETDKDDAIYFSNDNGASFVKIFEFRPTDYCNDHWGQFPPMDLKKLAAEKDLNLTSQCVIRFQQSGDENSNYDGMVIDNVRLYSRAVEYKKPPISDDFEAAGAWLDSKWSHTFADKTNTLATVVTRPRYSVGPLASIGFNQSRGVIMAQTCTGGPSTYVLDLHADLGGLGNAVMTFKIADINDETEVDDAIFLSNDGGVTFKKIYSFNFVATANEEFVDYSLDLKMLAAQATLSLTATTVIRFQWHGDENSNNDGIILDNVNIAGITSATEDFSENGPSIELFPNPAEDILTIKIAGKSTFETFPFSISNLFGQVIEQGVFSGESIYVDVQNWPVGSYFFKIEHGQKVVRTLRFVKN